MVPLNTKVEDIQKLLGYLGKQIGWVEQARVEKALGPLDDRKVGAMVEFGLILRDGSNLRPTERGTLFNTDPQGALREVLKDVDLYRATLEWVHYGSKSEVTVAEIGQYWESSHVDTIGDRRGSTLREGAVCFGRIVEGSAVGSFTIGRGGKETRVTFASSEVHARKRRPARACRKVERVRNGGQRDRKTAGRASGPNPAHKHTVFACARTYPHGVGIHQPERACQCRDSHRCRRNSRYRTRDIQEHGALRARQTHRGRR